MFGGGCGNKIAITDGKGFRMTFENGWTVSIQFGRGNYCGNRYDETEKPLLNYYGDNTAEVWAWSNKKSLDDVKGYLTPNEVADFISEIAALEA